MSSAPNKSRQSSKSASSPEPQTDVQAHSVSQPPSSEENAMDQPLESTLTATPPAPPTPSVPMSSTDSSPDSPPPAPIRPTPPVARPIAEPVSTEAPAAEAPIAEAPIAEAAPTPVTVEESNPTASTVTSDAQAAARQQPIPPASEPMQYRAIGLIRGKYVASDEQFTRGSIFTDDGYEIGAVLLGRVMSLVKKHVDLEEPHLWVVYPRTKEKGDGDLHVQVVGVWEPENLNRMMESSEQNSDESELDAENTDLDDTDATDDLESELDTDLDAAPSDAESDEPALEDEPELTNAELATESAAVIKAPEDAQEIAESAAAESEAATESTPESDIVAPVETEAASPSDQEPQSKASEPELDTLPPVPTSDLDDKYFSVRGEVIYQSIEEEQIMVKIRRIPRPGTDESKAFKVVLKGILEGKAVGYFWDLHVQRQGNMLVLQDGTLIAAVPPQKRTGKKPPFNRRGSGSGGNRRPGGGRPPQGGPPRKPSWQNREGGPLPRPSRPGERSDRPSPSQNREIRPPSPRPVKRRNPEKPEG